MSYILNIETATKNCSVALAQNGQTIICKEISELGLSHAEKLHVFIEQIVQEANIKLSDLKAIAVGQGPGSYTGLRIGTAAAKGLCYGLDIPLIAIDTLLILAQKITVTNALIVPMLDARRMEVYSTIYDENYQTIRGVEAQIIDENSFATINEAIYFIGDCNEKCKTVLVKDNFIFIDDVLLPSAADMSKLSYKKFQIAAFENLAYYEPTYLKDGVSK